MTNEEQFRNLVLEYNAWLLDFTKRRGSTYAATKWIELKTKWLESAEDKKDG